MSDVLGQVLRYKEQKDAQAKADINAIPQAMMQFQAGRQQATDNLLKSLTLQATLAQSGLRINQQGNQYSIAQDPNSLAYQKNSQANALAEAKIAETKSKTDARSANAKMTEQFFGGGQSGTGNLPPGTTYNTATGGFMIPMNQKLTEAEQATVAGSEKFEPLVSKITSLIDEGVLGKGDGFTGGAKRLGKQILAERGDSMLSRLITPDKSKLEDLSSAVAEIKKFAFSEGGKQLSPTEKQVVFAGLTLSGKSDDAIKRDFSNAIDVIRQKKIVAMGGANAVDSGSSNKNSNNVGGNPPVGASFHSPSTGKYYDAQGNEVS